MRTWFWTLLVLTLAVALAVFLRETSGNVLVMVNDLRIEVSLAFAVMSLVALFVGLYVLLRLLSWLTAIPSRLRAWNDRRVSKKEHELLEQGWTELLEGRYSHAEKDLTRLFDQTRSANRQVLAALSAARAAHALGEFERRDQLLARARETANTDTALSEAVITAGADLYLDQGEPQLALDSLLPLQQSGARHVHTLRLLLRAYKQLSQHEKVFELTRSLSRRGALPASEATQMIGTAAAALIRAGQHDDAWRKIWKDLKSEERAMADVALAAAEANESLGQFDEAAAILEQAIVVSFDPRLLAAYARSDAKHVARRLEKAESWLDKRPDDPDLLATLGTLCLQGQIWGQAEHYLQRSVSRRNDARVHALLGSLYDRLNRSQDATRHWRKATAVGAALPVLAADEALPAAETHLDPRLVYSEGLLDLPEPAQSKSVSEASTYRAHDAEELFDSAPIPYVAEGQDLAEKQNTPSASKQMG